MRHDAAAVKERPKREKKNSGAPAVSKQPKPRLKNDPKLVAKARELRDRYLEQFNSGLLLPGGKYAVGRALPAPAAAELKQLAA